MRSLFSSALCVSAVGMILSLGACNASDVGPKTGSGISVSNAMVMPPFPGRTTAMGTMVITNSGNQADALLYVTSEISANVEMHTHIQENNVMKMRRVERVDIAPHSSVEFKSGGHHLMMFETNLPEGVSTAKLNFTFERAGTIDLEALIHGADEGHSHH